MLRPKRDPDGRVASPCQSRCRIDALGVCQGCGRTINEIMDWYDSDDATRLQIYRNAQERMDNINCHTTKNRKNQ